MAPLSLKIILDEASVTKTLLFDTRTTVSQVHEIVKDRIVSLNPDKEYGFFLTSADDECSGVWLENHRTLEYYMLREGDSLYYLERMRNLRLRMLDGSVKTLQVDESKAIGELMSYICDKIGTTNYEEYGLCREHMEIEDEIKPMTGTLTLKRKAQAREKDAKLEQLSKKLKTDDNVEWLDQHKTLRELRVEPKETLLFKRRLFYSDRKVDSRDPVQLNLLYVQTRDAILDGRQIVTEEKAIEFAGLQCQIHFEDFSEEKHKPGFIENLREFLPGQYATSWGIEKKIFKEHRKHQGLSPLEAKNLYTKTARELPTYGVTFFLVKEKHKGKKKLIPRLLGINSSSVLRLDEETKEILQVWPLTQVKSYRAASESFTLDFGDYSEKEYAVKTNEAFRIKDILQGYIDIIRKKLAAPYNPVHTEGDVICEDNVEILRGTIIQNIIPSKIVEQSFVGPSSIISVQQGHRSSEGTTITTIHEVVTVTRGDMSQQGLKGEALGEPPNVFGKRLNRINSLSVKTVVLLSDGNEDGYGNLSNIVSDMENELPAIVKGVRDTAKNLNDEKSKKLLDELDELCDYINNLSNIAKSSDYDNDKLESANEIAKKLADISAQMYLSLDPKSKKRSQLINSSRNSFIADEQTEANLRRMSLRTVVETTHEVLDSCYYDLDQEYNATGAEPVIYSTLEKSVNNKLGKLNAAIASLIIAHSDPNEVNYSTAVTCMSTIKEIMPELVQDIKTLNSLNDDVEGRLALTDEIKKLIDRTAALCRLNGTDDPQKLQEAGNAFGEISRKLIYKFNRGNKMNQIADKENQILDLAEEVGESASNLLIEISELNNMITDDPRSEELDTAGVKCADAARELYECAKLTGPSIHEPHCQSALTGACEHLTSSVQHLIQTYKPIVDDPGRHYYGKRLANKVTDVNKALDKLMNAYANLNEAENSTDESSDGNVKKLQFTLSRARKALGEMEDQLLDDTDLTTLTAYDGTPYNANIQKLESKLSQKISQLNAAVATLLQATSSEKPDYGKVNDAVDVISQMTPEIIQDSKILEAHLHELRGGDETSKQKLLHHLKDLLNATKDVCSSADDDNKIDLNAAASKLAKSTKKLQWMYNPLTNANREYLVMEQAKEVGNKTSELLMDTSELVTSVGDDPRAEDLEVAGVRCADAAKGLITCAELTSPTIENTTSKSALAASCGTLESALQILNDTYKPIVSEPERYYYGNTLAARNDNLVKALDKLKNLCGGDGTSDADELPESQKAQKLKFVNSLSRCNDALKDAEYKLNDPSLVINNNVQSEADRDNLQTELSKKMSKLNAAIAQLLNSISGIPDYEKTNSAIDTIAQLTPGIIYDVRSLEAHGNGDEQKILRQNLQHILDATRDICNTEHDNKSLGDAVEKYAQSSGKLNFVLNRHAKPNNENQTMELARDVGDQTSVLLYQTRGLIGENDEFKPEHLKLNEAIVACTYAAKELETSAQVTAPFLYESSCQEALANAAKNLADKLEDLALAYKPFLQGPGQTMNRQTIVKKTMGVIEALDKLKAHATSQPEETKLVQNTFKEEGPKRLFKASLTESKNTLSDAIKLLERDDYVLKPFQKVVCDPSTSPKAYMSQNLAQLNASIASLLHATTDAPDYDAATSAIAVIPTLIPNIVKAGECIHGENPSENITAKITPLLMTIQEICKSADEGRHKDLNDNTMEFADQSEKIFIECNPHTNERKKSRILDLSKGACKDASIYLTKVYQLAQKVGADEATDLDVFGSKIVDTAQVLLTAAQVTAPTMEDLQCQNVLISFTDTFSKKIDDLDNMWAPLIGPHNEDLGDQMKSDSNTLRKTLTELRNICVSSSDDEDKEQLQSKVLGANDKLKAIEKLASKERLRELPEPPLLEFVSIMTKDQGCIEKTTIEPTKYLLCERLSQLNQSIALLLQTMSGRDRVDHKVHEELVQNISEMAPETIKYILSTHKYLEDDVQKEMIAEVKNLCESTQGILSSVGTENNEELSDAVSKYGYSTGKLYFIFSPYKKAERKKEAEIVQTARSACERTSLMLSRVSRLAQTLDASKAEPLDCTGVELADAAQALLTNAQLTSPSIRFECSQSVLAASVNKVNQLSSELGDAWSPLVSTDEQLCQQLDKDLMHLHTDLNKLKDIILESNQWIPLPDLETDENTIKKINTESKHDKDLSIEDTPLKDLASKILNSAKIMLESGNLTKEKHSVLKSFTNELTAALCALDLATARCKRDPMDAKKRQDLENVIQNVQHLCLVGQKEADSQTNIIDLMLFVKDVVTAANDLYQSTESVQSPSSKQALMTIRDACDDIIVKAESLSNPPDITDDALHDMLITEQFAQECDARVEIIQDSVADMSDSSSRNLLEEKLRCLIEKCNLLKFAAKGSVSSAFGLAIDEDLQKLVDAEKKIQLLLTINDQNKTTDYDKPMDIEAVKTAQKPFRYAVIAKQDNVPQALAQYAMRMIAATPRDAASQLKLKEHLNKLTNLLKKRNLASGRRVATWQDADADDVTDTTNQILQEIHGYISEDKTSYRSDLQALMTSNESVIDCDINELNSKLSQQTQKLSFMIGTVILNSDKPDGIAQAVHSTEKVVAEISALTKAIKNKDVIQGKKMEKATNYLIASMYNLHETSESISQEYEKPESRRKLLDACRTLTDALNKFAQASSRAGKVKADGEESIRNIQLEQVLLSPNLPTCALGLEDTLDALQAQGEIIQKLESEETTPHSEWGNTLRYAAAAACAGAQYSSHSAYLLSIAEDNADAAKKGLIDHIRFDQLSNNVDDVCSKIISGDKEQTKSLEPVLSKHIQQLSEFVDDCTVKLNEVESEKVKEDYRVINSVMDELKDEMNASPYRDDLVISRSFKLLDAINRLKTTIKRLPTPRYNPSTSEKHNLGVIMENAKKLLNETSGLVSQVTSSDDDLVTWLMGVELSGKQVIKSYEAILTCIRNKGKEMKLLQSSDVSNDDQEPPKSHLQTQMDLINKWLRNPACKQDVKNDAIRAAHNIIDMGDKMSEDLKDTEKDEMFHVVVESKELLKECSVKYQSDKASLLLERLRDLKGMLERGVVTRVVEEFLEEQPLEDMENIRKETDVKRRDLLLDKKIAELLAQLGRVSRTAKFVSDTTASPIRHDIIHSSEQVELLAPSLVKSAQESVRNQDDQAIENYHEMVMKYAESLNRVRELCDRAVNPMDFAQAAVETMARIKEVSKNDPIKATYAASIITRLGNRVVEAGMSSVNVQKDPELQQTLASIKKSITEAHHTKTDLATEIIRKTGEVESALGGENIFQKEPEADQPIFAAAHGLHAAVRDWSARDNEVVAVAKRVAVLMARLAHHMYNDRKAELILTSKEIVAKSHEVAALARKLAMECSDLRIRNNLLQVCQRIPLISGQLKMLTTVKGSTLGKQGSEEDMEAMNMLVGNAQNLMTSIQEIVKVAESASVKIMSQRGRKIRWVRRNYY